MLERVCFVAFAAFALLSTYPWIAIAGVEVRTLAFGVLAVGVLATAAQQGLPALDRRTISLLATTFVGVAAFIVSHAADGPGYYDTSDIGQFVRLLLVGAICYTTIGYLDHSRGHFWILGVAALALFSAAVILPLLIAGVNPFSLTFRSLRDNDIWLVINGVYARAAEEVGAETNGVAISATFRHEIMRGLLIPAGLSYLGPPPTSDRSRAVRGVATVLIAVIVVLSYSRSGILTLGLVASVPILAAGLGRDIVKREWQAIAGAGVALALSLLAFRDLILDRITDSDGASLETRTNAIEIAWNTIPGDWLLGSGQRIDDKIVRSPHMMPLDWWLGGGIIGALAAVTFVAIVLGAIVGTVKRQGATPRGTAARVQLWAASGLLCVVAVGAMTEGGGRMTTSLWLTLGVVLGWTARTKSAPDRTDLS